MSIWHRWYMMLLAYSSTDTGLQTGTMINRQMSRDRLLQDCICAQRRLRSDCTFAYADQSLRCPLEDALDRWFPTDCHVKTLIRLRAMRRLIWVIAGRTCNPEEKAMPRFKCRKQWSFASNVNGKGHDRVLFQFWTQTVYFNSLHYENTPIQIYWKLYHQKKKKENFKIKILILFYISAQNIDCGYSLEPPRRGGSNEYPQSMCLSRNKKNNVYPYKPQFYYIKVGFKGVKII